MTTKIVLDIKDCSECPKCVTTRTIGADYALDYHCGLMQNKQICYYIEWPSEMKPVPSWCPISLNNLKKGINL